ncbi:MAG: 4Fe-4S dicluster domain-containing protein [Bacteroidales bacterium]|nr:4Fe-4S dicluster domain-containing protein [Bacteroidales bacterium]MDD2424474.1 4Fe-4S dicluster domain-containing protein [Bacteroidales bacterium]MDD3988544.1 4Fe-4S dicluster domain-containing protein [Bacteroidales bacterium]MDD4638557.1 4Fe-4S dicluster domain-containing protein [Bacteroidales bacterium]
MEEFGFKISKSTRIDLDSACQSLYNQIASKVPDIRTCINCGSCSASCTAATFRRTSFRGAILHINRGFDKKAVEFLKSCMLCGKCFLVCPRGIDTRNIILEIIRSEEG